MFRHLKRIDSVFGFFEEVRGSHLMPSIWGHHICLLLLFNHDFPASVIYSFDLTAIPYRSSNARPVSWRKNVSAMDFH